MATQSKNKSKPSKGWRDLSPNRSERKKLLEKCGEKCFLIPSKLKFPICSKKIDCKLNCEGIDSASIRSGQYDYENVLKKAKSLYKRHCHPLSTRKSARKSTRKVKKSTRKSTRKSVRKSTRKVKKSTRKSTRKLKKSTRKVKKSTRKSARKSTRKVMRRV